MCYGPERAVERLPSSCARRLDHSEVAPPARPAATRSPAAESTRSSAASESTALSSLYKTLPARSASKGSPLLALRAGNQGFRPGSWRRVGRNNHESVADDLKLALDLIEYTFDDFAQRLVLYLGQLHLRSCRRFHARGLERLLVNTELQGREPSRPI